MSPFSAWSVFKILNIDEETNEFSEVMNMRVGKNLNLNFSCNDVVWSALEPSLLATGATNGAVVLWNLNRSNRNKLGNWLARDTNDLRLTLSDPSSKEQTQCFKTTSER
jgi:hypothetical protein